MHVTDQPSRRVSHAAGNLAKANRVGVSLLGCGIVGSAVARLLLDRADEYASKLGKTIRLIGAAVRDVQKSRAIPKELLSEDPQKLATHPEAQIVVELLGGRDPARELALLAIRSGKHLVTANKELIACDGAEIFEAARQAGVGVYYEGAVAGGIPLLLPLRRSLVANEIQALYGIVNGTTNYVLTRMSEDGMPYEAALAEAQQLGYTETDPTADVGGLDAAYKVAILATLVSGRQIPIDSVAREGITGITLNDLQYAREFGYAVKLLGIARRSGDRVEARVHPCMIPISHPLAGIRLVTNAIAVKGDTVGEVVFSGPGAGGVATASAVVADVLNAAEGGLVTSPLMAPRPGILAEIVPLSEIKSAFYLRLIADDKPGVLGALGTRFGTHGVSIRKFVQKETGGGKAELVFVTHPVVEGSFRDALAKIANHSAIKTVDCVLRVEDAI